MRLWRRRKKECRVASRPRWTRPALADGLLINCAGEEGVYASPSPVYLSTYTPTAAEGGNANPTQRGECYAIRQSRPRLSARTPNYITLDGRLVFPSVIFLKNHDRPQLPLRDWSISNLFSFWLPGGLRGTDPWVCCCMYACGWNTATWHVRFFSPSSLVNSTTKKKSSMGRVD